MPLDILDVITPTEVSEIETEILDLCATAGLPTSSWQSGSVVRTLILVVAQGIAVKTQTDPQIARSGFGDLVSEPWAELFAKYIYDVDAVTAKPATGYVTFTNTSATTYIKAIGEVIVAHSTSGATYRNQAAITIPALGTLSGVAISADVVGVSGNAAPSLISKMVSSLVGVSVTNPLPVLGADEESAAEIVARTRSKLGSLSPLGSKGAYDYISETPLASLPAIEGVTLTSTSTPITRSRTTADPTTGDVTVYLATAGGAPSGGDIALVQLGIDAWSEPWCVTSTAAAAAELTVDVSYQVWIRTSLSILQVQTAIGNALSTYLSTIPVGGVIIPPATGYVYQETLAHLIHSSTPGIERVVITVPSTDLPVSANQVPVLGAVTSTVNPI